MDTHVAKQFALQSGSLITLYISITSLLALIFGMITLWLPDQAAGVYEAEGAANSIRFASAALIVFFPTYLILTRLVNQSRRRKDSKYLGLTKWLIYLSLLLAGLILLGNLAVTIYTFLNGELTMRFFLKAASLFDVIGVAFLYYFLDARGYWEKNEKMSLLFAGVVTVAVLAALVIGWSMIDTPGQAREGRLDARQVRDLQDMQWRIEEYWRLNEILPTNLNEAYGSFEVPTAPTDREPYSYERRLDGFSLCATFAYESSRSELPYARPYFDDNAFVRNAYSWDYSAGRYCFERTLTNLQPTAKTIPDPNQSSPEPI